MKDSALTNIEFKKGDVMLPVLKFQIASLCLFVEYCKYRTRVGDPIRTYRSLTQEDLDDFNMMAPVTVTAPIPGSSTYPPPIYDLAMKEFNRGIKRDPNHFQTFSNERNWSDYNNGDAVELFTAKHKYVFQVFITNLKTDKGKDLVKQYKVNFDAQSVWKDLLAHMKTSTIAKISTRKIFQYITNIRIDDRS